jgi:BON domain
MCVRRIVWVTVALMGVCGVTAAAGPPPEADPTLRDLKVTAARDGSLTLSGQANSQAAAQRTIQIARDSDGVKRVQSRLTVVHRAHR